MNFNIIIIGKVLLVCRQMLIMANYGMTRYSKYGTPRKHNGVDIVGNVGDNVYAVASGTSNAIKLRKFRVTGLPLQIIIVGAVRLPLTYQIICTLIIIFCACVTSVTNEFYQLLSNLF
ncbi:MAG: hypothetical protein QM487_12820 [Candidatus Marithrix sp.]